MQMIQQFNQFKFQLTTSRRGRRIKLHGLAQLFTFQLTTSRRGRRFCPTAYSLDKYISTHDLTKRSTSNEMFPKSSFRFQLTTSRRGRRIVQTIASPTWHFNSRPHEEVDKHRQIPLPLLKNFNSRPHEEVDMVQVNRNIMINISTHDLTKRSTHHPEA